MGKTGMPEAASLNLKKSHYAVGRLMESSVLSLPFSAPFFNEFVVRLPEGLEPEALNARLLAAGYIGGYSLGGVYPELAGHMLVAVTERRTKEEIDGFVRELEACV